MDEWAGRASGQEDGWEAWVWAVAGRQATWSAVGQLADRQAGGRGGQVGGLRQAGATSWPAIGRAISRWALMDAEALLARLL